MKVDELSALMRITAMLDWYHSSDAYKIPIICTTMCDDTDNAQLKQSVQGWYNQYCEILEETFGIKRSVVDLFESSNENTVSLATRINQPLWDFVENVVNDPSAIETSSNPSLYNWEKFIRTISKIDIALMVNQHQMFTPNSESIASLDFDRMVSTMPQILSRFVYLYKNRKNFSARIDGMISLLTVHKTTYEMTGIDGIREAIEYKFTYEKIGIDGIASILENLGGRGFGRFECLDQETLESMIESIQDPDHYQALVKELFIDASLDPPKAFVEDSKGLIAEMERYYSIVDEIYHDMYLIAPTCTWLR